jgi:hypothetical protein
MFENVPKPGEDRLVSAACRLVDALPLAGACSPRKPPNEAGCEQAACQVSLRRITRNALREIASDRGDRRMRDVGVGAGSKDLSDDHWQPPLSGGGASSYGNRICSQHVIARKNLLSWRKVNV